MESRIAGMVAARGFATPFSVRLPRRADVGFLTGKNGAVLEVRRKKRLLAQGELVTCCCSEIRGVSRSAKSTEKFDERKRPNYRGRVPVMPLASPQSRYSSKQEKFFFRCTPRNSGPQSRDSPPKRDTGIANEKDWGINLLNDNVSESGTNDDGSTWYRESGEDLGDNGYRCRWTRMGGQSADGTSEWKETVDAFNWIC